MDYGLVIGYLSFKLFISLLAMLGLRPLAQAFSCCGEEGLLFLCGSIFPLLLFSWPTDSGSVVVVNRLSCSVAGGIFLDQGLNPCPLHWQVGAAPPGKSHNVISKQKVKNIYCFLLTA